MKKPSSIIHQEQDQKAEEKDRKEMDRDPLAKLNKSRTRRLEEFLMLSAEDNDSFFSHA